MDVQATLKSCLKSHGEAQSLITGSVPQITGWARISLGNSRYIGAIVQWKKRSSDRRHEVSTRAKFLNGVFG